MMMVVEVKNKIAIHYNELVLKVISDPAHYKESINTFCGNAHSLCKPSKIMKKTKRERKRERKRRVGPCERNDAAIKAKRLIIVIIHMYSRA